MAKKPPIRVRKRPDPNPILLTTCGHCRNDFWFRPSMGLRVNNGHYESLKLECAVCHRPHYVRQPGT
jgi:hypothetical protein